MTPGYVSENAGYPGLSWAYCTRCHGHGRKTEMLRRHRRHSMGWWHSECWRADVLANPHAHIGWRVTVP